MKSSEIRSRFIKFFQRHDHHLVPSSSLIPGNDPTLLFTNAGMVQFKDIFTGDEKADYKRATSVQKCVRAGGKHNDLENVGFTARHHTFFEMLGNFSFGDYFKKEAIELAWEFVTKELNLATENLYISIHLDDDEAFEVWTKHIGITPERIYRFDKDNFWSMAETGPCGPCSEIFIDRGPEHGCQKASCEVGCECDRFMEIWNLVFMQYDRDEGGSLKPLPLPCVDTGMGLERLTSVLQKVPTNYDIDLFVELIDDIRNMEGVDLRDTQEEKFALRVVADHSRSTAFLIADGVIPANEGRGYVLRRIIRRAIRYGRNLGFREPFLHKTCGFVIAKMREAYPELEHAKELINKLVTIEEEQFFRTLERGLSLLDDEMAKSKKLGVLAGDVAFKLYDTYGFPLDLTRIICNENHISVDEDGFTNCMNQQRNMSRQGTKSHHHDHHEMFKEWEAKLEAEDSLPRFVGYQTDEANGDLIALFKKEQDGYLAINNYVVDGKSQDEIIYAVFDQTPFYAESGGQVADKGAISDEEFFGEVVDVTKPIESIILLHIRPKKGLLTIGNEYYQKIDSHHRARVAKNHTATHILHYALRNVLGDHVKQSGSYVGEDQLRFDFSHYAALTPEEIARVEALANEKIWHPSNVSVSEMMKEEAIALGAIAFFGEKYGSKVRVVETGDFSTELCGGTHVESTTQIGMIKIVSESSIAAGIRRIVAYTSRTAFEYLRLRDEESRLVRERLKASSFNDLELKLDKLFETQIELRKQLEKEKSKGMKGELDSIIAAGVKIADHILINHLCSYDESGIKKLRELANQIRQKTTKAIMVLGMRETEQKKAFLLVAKTPDALETIKANELINGISSHIEGRGGGKPDMAQSGGSNPKGIETAFANAKKLVEELLNG